MKIKHVLFLMFGVTSFIIFYIGLLNFITTEDQFIGSLILVFSVIVAIGALIGTLYISKKITKPIDALIIKMNEFSKTNKIQNNSDLFQGIQEFQYLHENFERMANIVGKNIDKEKKLNQQLQDIDKRKVEFMSMVSHELKTPIMPILGYIQLLKKEELLGKLNDKQLDAINEIYLSTVRLQKLIQDVLTAQKIDLNNLSISKRHVHVNEIINNSYNAFMPICKIKGIELQKKTEENYEIFTDPDRMNQIFSNLISNALDFVEKGNGKIEIGCYGVDEKITFFVRDNGMGISKVDQKNIFKKFYQVDASSKRKKEGSGLGLAICEGLVKNMGGEIKVKSQLMKGAEFYFSLPKNKIQITNF